MKNKLLNKKTVILFILVILFVSFFSISKNKTNIVNVIPQINDGGPKEELHPLSIEYMRGQEYSGSDIVIEQTLPTGSNYDRYIASYKSDGLKIYSLLTIPKGEKPATGFPVVIFNHGYIPPTEYRTTEKYAAYTDAFSRNGYIVLKSDYRGHGNSEGNPEGAYYSPAYTIDVLNALASIKRYKDADPERIGMWGHSMGGSITLRSMVVDAKDIKAGVIWAGVVASYEDMANNWRRRTPFMLSEREQAIRRPGRQSLIDKYGSFEENPAFWRSIAPISFTSDIEAPIQLHHGTNDQEVPLLFSQKLDEALKNSGKEVEFYTYEGDDHNISANLSTALSRSVDFFDKYVKGNN